MKLPAYVGPLLAGVIALAICGFFFNSAELPDLFPLSSVVLPAIVTFLLALGIGLLLPNFLYFTHTERLEEQLRTASGSGGFDPKRILARADEAKRHANTLRASTVNMQSDIAEATKAAAEDLDELAERILKNPYHANSSITIIMRAGLVVDAVTDFVEFKNDTGAQPEQVEKARKLVIASLKNMSGAADDVHSRLAQVKLTEIDVATDVADGLFGQGNK